MKKRYNCCWTIILRNSSNYQVHQDYFKEQIMPVQGGGLGGGWERGKNRLKYCSCLPCCFLPVKEISCCMAAQVQPDLSCRPSSRVWNHQLGKMAHDGRGMGVGWHMCAGAVEGKRGVVGQRRMEWGVQRGREDGLVAWMLSRVLGRYLLALDDEDFV